MTHPPAVAGTARNRGPTPGPARRGHRVRYFVTGLAAVIGALALIAAAVIGGGGGTTRVGDP